MNQLPSSRKQAMVSGEKFYFTGNPCVRGHIAKRRATNGCCSLCSAENNKRYKKHEKSEEQKEKERKARKSYWLKNKEFQKEKRAAYRLANKERQAELGKAWAERNKERVRENFKRWVSENKERYLAGIRSYQDRNKELVTQRKLNWSARNRDYYTEQTQRRNAKKIQATPAWANAEAIRKMYRLARQLTNETGIQHQVDHIVPLRSKLVCGLHIHNNLQILTYKENISKGNRVWPNMP